MIRQSQHFKMFSLLFFYPGLPTVNQSIFKICFCFLTVDPRLDFQRLNFLLISGRQESGFLYERCSFMHLKRDGNM